MRLTEIGVKELAVGTPAAPTVSVEDDTPKKSRKKKKAEAAEEPAATTESAETAEE